MQELKLLFEREAIGDVKIYCLDIGSGYTNIKNILENHDVDFIVHAAALKILVFVKATPTGQARVIIFGPIIFSKNPL